MVLGVQTQQRRATASVWSASGKVLAAGEFGVTTDTKIIKIGDGVNEWDDLPIAFEDLYLTIGGTASNADLLGGISSSGFVKTVDATTAATADKVAKRDGSGRLKAAAGASTDDVVNFTQLTAAGVDARKQLVSRVVSANFTLQAADAGSMVIVNNNAYTPATTCTIPTNASVPIPLGTFVDILTADKGPVSFVAAGGVTVFGQSLIYGAVSSARLLKTDTDGWIVTRVNQSPGPILRRKIKSGTDNTITSTFSRVRLDGANSGTALFSNNADTLGSNEQYNSGTDLYRCFARRSGWYDVTAVMSLGLAAAGRFYVQLRVNDIDQHLGTGVNRGGSAEMSALHNARIPLSVGDYLEVWAFQEAAGTNTVSESPYASSAFDWAWQRPL